jgi:Mg2+/Co2+ transporter CorB
VGKTRLHSVKQNFGEAKGVRKMKKKDMKLLSQILIAGAIISVILAGIGYLGIDIWLASTQWLLVAAVLALFGIYTQQVSK